MVRMKNIFGYPECKQEVMRFGEAGYQEVFFDETPFNEPSLDQECYLIIGRRGSERARFRHANRQRLLHLNKSPSHR